MVKLAASKPTILQKAQPKKEVKVLPPPMDLSSSSEDEEPRVAPADESSEERSYEEKDSDLEIAAQDEV